MGSTNATRPYPTKCFQVELRVNECKLLPLRCMWSIALMSWYMYVLMRSSAQGLTPVPIFAQLELTFPPYTQLNLTLSPILPKVTRGCVPKVLKLSSNASDVSRRSSG